MDKVAQRELCEFATRIVDGMVDSHLVKHGPEWIRAWYQLRLSWSETEPEYVLLSPWHLRDFARRAQTEPDVFDLCLFASGTRLRAGVHVPKPLGQVVASYLENPRTRPRRNPGPGRDRNWSRNFIIFALLEELMQQHDDLPVGKNRDRWGIRGKKTHLADIASKGIKESRLRNVEATEIQRVWENTALRAEYREVMKLFYLSLLEDEQVRV